MSSHSKNLIAAVADLKQRRKQIDDAIASVETILATVYGVNATTTEGDDDAARDGDAAQGKNHGHPTMQPRPGSRSDRVRRVFAENSPEFVWDSVSLAKAIGEPPEEATLKAIHAILSRLRKGGHIELVDRGQYRAARTTHQNTSGPDESGPEGDVTTDEEGGPQLETPSHDPDHSTTGWNRDRGDHPVVAG